MGWPGLGYSGLGLKAGSSLSRTCRDIPNRSASRTRQFEPMLEIPEFLAAEHMKGVETSVSVFLSFFLPTPPLSHHVSFVGGHVPG